MYRVLSLLTFVVLGTPTANAQQPVVNEVDPIFNPYQQAVSTSCPTDYTCHLTFPAITHTRLLIKHISCSISLANLPQGGVGFTQAFLTGSSFNEGSTSFHPIEIGSDSGEVEYEVSESAYLFFNKNDVPTVYINPKNITHVTEPLICTLSGYYYDYEPIRTPLGGLRP